MTETATQATLIYVQGQGLRYLEIDRTTCRVPAEAQVTDESSPPEDEYLFSDAGFKYRNPDAYTHLITIGGVTRRFRQHDSTPYLPDAYGQAVSEVRGSLLPVGAAASTAT